MASNELSPLARMISPLIAPDVFDFWASKFSKTMAWDRVLAKVVERRVEARDTVTLVLKHNRKFPGFHPGQHVNVTVEVNGVRLTRSYSPTNLPGSDRRLAITVKRMAGGKVSHQLCSHTKVGDVLELGGVFGEMSLDKADGADWLFVAGGSGITPLISLTRALAAQNQASKLTLLYWARNRADLCFVSELKALEKSQPGFKVHFVLTGERELLTGEFSGRPSRDLLAQLVPDAERRRVYACGPAGFVTSVSELLKDTAHDFTAESFSPLQIDSSSSETVRIHLTASQRMVEVPVGQSLLSALEEQGVRPAYGCRIGICKTCVCKKTAGVSRDLLSGESEPEPSQALRLCVSSAVTDLNLEL